MTETNGGARLGRIEERQDAMMDRLERMEVMLRERIEMVGRDTTTVFGLRLENIQSSLRALEAASERDAANMREAVSKLDSRVAVIETWMNNFKGRAAVFMFMLSLLGGGLVSLGVSLLSR